MFDEEGESECEHDDFLGPHKKAKISSAGPGNNITSHVASPEAETLTERSSDDDDIFSDSSSEDEDMLDTYMPPKSQSKGIQTAGKGQSFIVAPTPFADEVLAQLLSPEKLAIELTALKAGSCLQSQPRGYKAPDTAATIKLLMSRNVEYAQVVSVLASTNNIPSDKQDHPALGPDLILYRLQQAVSGLPGMLLESHNLGIIQCAVQMDACRCLVVIYDWFAHSGPSLVNNLFATFEADGEHGLQASFPLYAPAVLQVHQYIQLYMALNARPPKRAKPGSVRPITSLEERTSAFKQLKDLACMPVHFHGVVKKNCTSKATFNLPKPSDVPCLTLTYLQKAS